MQISQEMFLIIAGIMTFAIVGINALLGMAKFKSIYAQTITDFNKTYDIDQEIPTIADVQGFKFSDLSTATFGAGGSAVRDQIEWIKVITDDSFLLHEIQNWQDDAIDALFMFLNRTNTPTSEDHTTTVQNWLQWNMPLPVARSMANKAKIQIHFKAGTTINSNITALSNVLRLSAQYGAVEEMIRITSATYSDVGPSYENIQYPSDKGNVTGFFVMSTDADLIHPNTTIQIEDDNGVPVRDTQYASEIVAENEAYLGFAWKGLYKGLYILYIDVPLFAGKSTMHPKIKANGTLTNGIQIYWLTDYADQDIDYTQVSARQYETGEYPTEAVTIRKFDSLEDALNRTRVPMVSLPDVGEEVADVEKASN
jgi:hypothetical protein